MSQFIKLSLDTLRRMHTIDPRLMSYNIEMTEVTGGTFWREYTEGQMAGTEKVTCEDWQSLTGSLVQHYEPVDLRNKRLISLSKAFGPVWIRVGGTWATRTYYDLDSRAGGVVPEGYDSILTEEQWKALLDFVKAVDAKLLVSMSNCDGIHAAGEPWKPDQAELLFAYSKNYGVPIAAAEFMNEPNALEKSGAPAGYTASDYCRDQDVFFRWLRENYPETLCVGPCTIGDASLGKDSGMSKNMSAIAVPTDALCAECRVPGDVFSYHCYNGPSERLTHMDGHWDASEALGEDYLALASNACRFYQPFRDKYYPGAQMWVTESADACGGGGTWAGTYLDVFRTLDELGSFAKMTDGVIFHNTLASSDYSFLKRDEFDPRPDYWAVLLWNRLMGTTVYDCGEEIREGVHMYAHSRRDGRDGACFMVINNSRADTTIAELPKDALRYTLSAESLLSAQVLLNGQPLQDEDGRLPEITPVEQPAGTAELAPCTVTFFLV